MRRLVGLVVALVVVMGSLPGAIVRAQGDDELWPMPEWQVSTPEEQGMDSDVLVMLMERIAERQTDIDSLLVVRHGAIVLEAYWAPYDARTRHGLASVAKSVVSALIGAAIEQGYISGVDVPVLDFFPGVVDVEPGDPKLSMTLEDLLTMQSGLRCHDETDATVEAMQRTDDWAAYMLRQPMVDQPGRTFNYCNGVSHLLSVIVGRATGQNTMDFAQESLFRPLGITRVLWERDPDGNPAGGWGLAMTPRDMARFGYLYLRDGWWNGTQILPTGWVDASATLHSYSLQSRGWYGYQWWVSSVSSFQAVGAGGQYIFVRRGADMVVVMTSDTQIGNYPDLLELMDDYVLYASKSDEPLPANPEGVAALQSLIAAAASAD